MSRIIGGHATTVTAPGGFAGNSVRSIFCDSEGDLWIGGHDLTRLKDGRFSVIGESDGLPVNPIKAIIEDDLGYLWLSTAHGILRANRRLLDRFCDTGRGRAEFSVFSKADGLPSNECSGNQPAAWKGPDGRLWFATLNGLAVIDPKHIPKNELPPPVVIEAVVADEKSMLLPQGNAPADSRDSPIRIPAGTSRLEFHFAALSYTAPEKNRYRFRLEGFDSEWVRVGGAQVAGYTRLPPGPYRFQVCACNNDGVWNETGATLAVSVLPFFWQTEWFHALIAAVIVGLIYWLFRARLAHVERRRLVQESFARQVIETQEAERQRIARELHDSVGQTLLLVKNHLSLGIRKAEPASPIMEDLGQASAEVSQAIEEVRATARALRPVELDRLGLGKALESMLDRIAATTPTRLSSELDDLGKLDGQEVEIQLYRIAQEAITNVLKHSKANEVIVELKREGKNLRLTVQDDGIGFNPECSSLTGGFGLPGMAERARLVGAAFSVKAAPGKGCRLTVTMPLPKTGHE